MASAVLERELVGEPVYVKLGRDQFRLAFPMEAVILYKQKTAEIDRRRGLGREKLKASEVRELQDRQGKALEELRTLTAEQHKGQVVDLMRIELLRSEAHAIDGALDADAGTGDSLFHMERWRKIDPEQDPERFLTCLWAGLHTHHPELSLADLSARVDFGNVMEVLVSVTKALTAYFPKASDDETAGAQPDPALAGTAAK